MPGDWSNEMKVTTESKHDLAAIFYKYFSL